MYPLVAVLGVAAALDRPAVALPAPLLAIPGAGVAAAHSWLQWQVAVGAPPGCGIGGSVSCGAVQYRVAGLSVPNLSLIAFLLICAALLGAYVRYVRGERGDAVG